MKTYEINSKVYTSMTVPISDSETFVILPKGHKQTAIFNEIPEVLLGYQQRGIISIKEI